MSQRFGVCGGSMVMQVCCCCCFLAMLGSSVAYASLEKITVEACYLMGDDDTKRDARERCLMDAKRIAIERSGTYLVGKSQVDMGKLEIDLILSEYGGKLRTHVLDERWQSVGSSLKLFMKVEVEVSIDERDLEQMHERLVTETQMGSVEEEQGFAHGIVILKIFILAAIVLVGGIICIPLGEEVASFLVLTSLIVSSLFLFPNFVLTQAVVRLFEQLGLTG